MINLYILINVKILISAIVLINSTCCINMQILDGSDIKHAEDSFDNIKPLCHELLQRKLELINDNNNARTNFCK